MIRPSGRLVSCLAPVLASVGCTNLRTTTQMQFDRMDAAKAAYGEVFETMVDNAILRDMSIADIHFIANSDELNGIGAARLERMAKLLSAYGGTVRYETNVRDEALVARRMAHVREFLALTECDMERVDVAVMRAGGRGLPGREAVAKYRESTTPSSDSGGNNLLGNLTGNQ